MKLIATKKLYQLMSLDEYHVAQQAHVQQTYGQKIIRPIEDTNKQFTVVKRWDCLLNQFKLLAPDCEAEFSDFQIKRKNTNTNLLNLSLESCLDYFENFYFLYTTEDPHFKLNADQKKRLLEAIQDAMGTCETGITTRFELVLQQFRTDLDWVRDTLSKCRYQLLIGIQDGYNIANNISHGMQVHVLKVMTQTAADHNLGIKIDHQIKDVFANFFDGKGASDYFKQHYPQVYATEYEEKVVDILSEHLLFEIQERYCAPPSDWKTIPISIPADGIVEFNKFIADHLCLDGINFSDVLGELDEDTFALKLKDKQEVLSRIQGFMKQKLVKEGYFVPFDQLAREKIVLLNSLKLRKGVNITAILDFNEALINCKDEDADQISPLLVKYHQTILQYPNMLLSQIEKHPTILSKLPKALKTDAYFVEQSIEALDPLLLQALDEDNQDSIDQHISTIFNLVKKNTGYINKLSPALLNHVPLALRLVEKDGLLLKNIPEHVQNEDIVEQAIKQNPLALLYAANPFKENNDLVRLALQNPKLEYTELNDPTFENYLETCQKLYTKLYVSLPDAFLGIDNYPCGLIKLGASPKYLTVNYLKILVKDKPAYVLHNETLYFINKNGEAEELTYKDDILNYEISNLEYFFDYELQTASLKTIQKITSMTGHVHNNDIFIQTMATPDVSNDKITPLITTIQKMESVHALLTPKKLSTGTVARLAQSLSPDLLIKIIQQREQDGSPPLPYCDGVSKIKYFQKELAENNIQDWDNGYLFLKKQACELNRGNKKRYDKNAVGFLAKSDLWYMSMVEHQRFTSGKFKSWEQFWLLFTRTIKAIALLLWSISKLSAILIVGTILLMIHASLIALIPLGIYIGLAVLAIFGAWLIKQITDNRRVIAAVTLLSLITYVVLFTNLFIGAIMALLIVNEVIKLPSLIMETIHSISTLLTRLFQSIFSSPEHILVTGPDANLRIKCEESIARLQLMKDTSAHEKSDLLELLWGKINEDIPVETPEAEPIDPVAAKAAEKELARHLNKAYLIEYHGKNVEISFNQAAAISRSNSKPFEIPADVSVSKFSFFKTTTTKILPPPAQDLEQAPAFG